MSKFDEGPEKPKQSIDDAFLAFAQLHVHEKKRRQFPLLVPPYKLLAEHESRMLSVEGRGAVKTSIQEFWDYTFMDRVPTREVLDRINAALGKDMAFMEAYLRMQLQLGNFDYALAKQVFTESYPDSPYPELLLEDMSEKTDENPRH